MDCGLGLGGEHCSKRLACVLAHHLCTVLSVYFMYIIALGASVL